MSYDIEAEEQECQKVEHKQRLWDWLRKLRRDEQTPPSNDSQPPDTPPHTPSRKCFGQRLSKTVGVGIPRSTTFRRQEEEQRKNLEPVEPTAKKRRAFSRLGQRALSAQPKPLSSKKPRRELSAPDLSYHQDAYQSIDARLHAHDIRGFDREQDGQIALLPPPPPPPPYQDSNPDLEEDAASQASFETSNSLHEKILNELQKKWILNLSMHFRDKSPREKFFITYAQTSQRWRRVTVSCDYRHVEIDSLEDDLRTNNSQQDKSEKIYESLRGSLGDIQFYDTVTNLKLETKDDRLHVHVTEDVNEIIPYPPIRSFNHLKHVQRFKESELHFLEHMSGFVYKVDVRGKTWIKKEISGPDSVDEFLYEVNALSSLTNAENVIELEGLVTSEDGESVKGLLIAYAENNALVDIIYDNQGKLPWPSRERWARQIVKGLSEIHEAGFVQGDFTLSNIVIDGNDDAQIIDINRRGCPVGWEPPEIAKLIDSGERISMFIGVKSDLFQLGMVLWGLAMEEDEPEKQRRPLRLDGAPDEILPYFRALVARCLDPNPAIRLSAKDMLKEFPGSRNTIFRSDSHEKLDTRHVPPSVIAQGNPAIADLESVTAGTKTGDGELATTLPQPQEIPVGNLGIDNPRSPLSVIEHEYRDVLMPGASQSMHASSTLAKASSTDQEASLERFPKCSNSNVEASDYIQPTEIVPHRGRRTSSEDGAQEEPQIISISPTGEPSWEEVTMGGAPYLIHRDTLDSFEDDNLTDPPPDQRQRRVYRWSGAAAENGREFEHVDSGLGDMDLGSHPLAGIGLGFAERGISSLETDNYHRLVEQEHGRGFTDDLGGVPFAHESGHHSDEYDSRLQNDEVSIENSDKSATNDRNENPLTTDQAAAQNETTTLS